MRILNLDEQFAPLFGLNEIEFEKFSFPSGCEPHFKLKEGISRATERVVITHRIQKADHLIEIMLAADALRRCQVKSLCLVLPYLPFARQDRMMDYGEPLSVKVMADILNSLNFDRVVLFDVHSEVSLALINNSVSIRNYWLVKDVLKDYKGGVGPFDKELPYVIVSPDAGAYKKIFHLCQAINYTGEIVQGTKVRDTTTGKIKGMSIDKTDLSGKNAFIIDDICDGGGTFIGLAEKLKDAGAEKVGLVVSHGIFSKGTDLPGIDHIWTTNSFKYHEFADNLTVFKLKLIDPFYY